MGGVNNVLPDAFTSQNIFAHPFLGWDDLTAQFCICFLKSLLPMGSDNITPGQQKNSASNSATAIGFPTQWAEK